MAHGGFCSRYGGDEFVIIYEAVSKEEAESYAAQLRQKVLDLNIAHRYSKAMPVVTISQGMFCDVPQKENRVWDFLHIADEVLYSVKSENRNSYSMLDRDKYFTLSGQV